MTKKKRVTNWSEQKNIEGWPLGPPVVCRPVQVELDVAVSVVQGGRNKIDKYRYKLASGVVCVLL